MPLYLIRHGETDGNRDKIVQQPDTELSVLGFKQAQELAKHFSKRTINLIFCSDYVRTQQTAAPLVAALGCSISYSELLRERNFGDIRGKHYDEIGHDFHQQNFMPPNGESIEQFSQRIGQTWQYILKQWQTANDNIIVMTHGLVLRELVNNHLDLRLHQNWVNAEYANTSVIEVDSADFKTVLTLCDTSHLTFSQLAQGGVA
jgi:probable phosphoglycerate mutase